MNCNNFKTQIDYESTFIENNSSLIKNITASDFISDYTRSDFDLFAGIDLSVASNRKVRGLALRIRRPKYEKWNKNFTISGHINKPNSQIKVILNSIENNACYPHLVLQINGVDNDGSCIKAKAILIESNVLAKYIMHLIDLKELNLYYEQKIDAYEFNFYEIFEKLETGVKIFGIKDNYIYYEISNS